MITYLFSELLTVPPDFDRGLTFAANGCTVIRDNSEQVNPEQNYRDEMEDKPVNLMDLVQQQQELLGFKNTDNSIVI